jgi:hypothetical protein
MSIFSQFIKSFYSTKHIASYRFQKIGKTMLYVFFLSLLVALPMIYHTYSLANQQMQFFKEVAKEEVPDFEIKNGVLETNNPTQIVKERPTSTFIFDPNVTEIPSTYKNNLFTVAILKDKAIMNTFGNGWEVSYDTLTETVTKQTMENYFQIIEDMKPVLLVVIILLTYLSACFVQFFYTTIFAALGLLLKGPHRFTYKNVWNMTAYAMTIPAVFFIIMDAFMISIPFPHFLLYSFVTMMILFFTIREIPTPKK